MAWASFPGLSRPKSTLPIKKPLRTASARQSKEYLGGCNFWGSLASSFPSRQSNTMLLTPTGAQAPCGECVEPFKGKLPGGRSISVIETSVGKSLGGGTTVDRSAAPDLQEAGIPAPALQLILRHSLPPLWSLGRIAFLCPLEIGNVSRTCFG